jgi:trimethylguanosine synthase
LHTNTISQIAQDLIKISSPSTTTIIDIFAGAGGNSISFALSGRWENVIAIERNPSVLACAQRNAIIYGVAHKITWVNADSFEWLPKYLSPSTAEASDPALTTTIFASPPWGGPGYTTDKIFDLSGMQPYSMMDIYNACCRCDMALFLPRTSDLRQIAKLARGDDKIEVVQYCMEGASKALVAYIPHCR